MRIAKWETRLNDVLSDAFEQEFSWGQNDCFMIARRVHKAVTGKALLSSIGRYSSERGGYKQFKKAGFGTLDAALSSVLKSGPVLEAKRGDIGLMDGGEHQVCVVCGSFGWLAFSEHGLQRITFDQVTKRFVV